MKMRNLISVKVVIYALMCIFGHVTGNVNREMKSLHGNKKFASTTFDVYSLNLGHGFMRNDNKITSQH